MEDFPNRPDAPLKVGVSDCLLGKEVRYDGTGARSSMPHDRLEGLFDYTSFCPEVAIGMPVPRPPIRLVGYPDDYQVVGVKDPTINKTQALKDYAESVVPQIGELSGYVFMHNSPSCGLFRVKVYPPGQDGPGVRQASGRYAASLIEALPQLPVEEAGRLFDDAIRENFVTRVFTYAHWQLMTENLTAARLIEFHSRYKYLVMAHSIQTYQEVGRLLSNLKGDVEAKAQAYILLVMQGLKQPATRKGHTNVLAHLQGYLKRQLPSADRQELDQVIQAYRRGEQPLLAPITLLKHHFRQFPDEYVLKQSYLDPHPAAAALRIRL
ncbi:MAG: DUF523 and DUF1722 domain-containing protein [Pseudomonadota bacterium]